MAMTFFFKADGSQYAKGLEKMRGQTKAWSSGIKGMMAGIFAGGALIGLKRWADGLDRIHKLSLRLGKTTDSLQRIGLAAELNGTSLETLANALTKVEQNAGQAQSGLKTYSDAFDRLGIETESFINLKPEDQIIALSKAYQDAKKEGTGVADILTILGGRAKEVLPLLAQTPEDLKKVFESASVASENSIKNMVDWNDKWSEIKNTIAGFLSWFVDAFQAVGVVIGAFVGMTVGVFTAGFKAISKSAAAAGNAIMNGLTGNFDQAKKNIGQLKGAYDKFFTDLKIQGVATNEAITEAVGDIYGIGKNNRPQKQKFQVDVEKPVDEFKEGDPFKFGKKVTHPEGDPFEFGEDVKKKIVVETVGETAAEAADRERQSTERLGGSAIATELARMGGGGNVATFNTSKATPVERKQTSLLESIEKNTKPPGGTTQTPEF